MNHPDTSKLPKWAQEHIHNLERERNEAIKALHDFRDAQTPGPVSYKDLLCTGEEQSGGPTSYTRYIQSHTVVFEHNGVRLTVMVPYKGDPARERIQLQWERTDRRVGIRAPGLIPTSYCCADIQPHE